MYQGNWKCSSCDGSITELPFQPRSESGLTCRTCFIKSKEAEKSPSSAPIATNSDEPMSMDDVPDFEESSIASEPMSADDALAGLETVATSITGDKPKFEGNWTCSLCGSTITSLPFQPRDTSGLKCFECFKESKR